MKDKKIFEQISSIEKGFAAVLARAGVGKTEFLVKIALTAMLKSKNLLHISLDESVKKICIWYDELLKTITDKTDEHILSKRFIMTFKKEKVSFKVFEERFLEISEQGIFTPQIVIIDGFEFQKNSKDFLLTLKKFTEERDLLTWFTVLTHRSEAVSPNNGIPLSFSPMSDIFETLAMLEPNGKEVDIKLLKAKENI